MDVWAECRGAARRPPTQPASKSGGSHQPKPLGFKALALGEHPGAPRHILVHGPLHRHLAHAEATPDVAWAGTTVNDHLAGSEPKSRPIGLRTGKNGRIAVEAPILDAQLPNNGPSYGKYSFGLNRLLQSHGLSRSTN